MEAVYGTGKDTVATIELAPEIVFELHSDVSSPSSTLCSESLDRTPLFGSHKRHPYTDLLFPRSSRSLPRQTYQHEKSKFERDALNNRVRSSSQSVGDDQMDADSEYGIVVSIKDIKGHPFVILEDKDQHKHMVLAPESESLPGVTDKRPEKAPSPCPGSRYASAHEKENGVPYSSAKSTSRARPRQREVTKSSAGRSRSLPPSRVNENRMPNRSRSMSPPLRSKSMRSVNFESIKPVSSLIGYFEKGSLKSDQVEVYRTSPKGKNQDSKKLINSVPATILTSKKSSHTGSPHVATTNEKNERLTGRYFALTSPMYTERKKDAFFGKYLEPLREDNDKKEKQGEQPVEVHISKVLLSGLKHKSSKEIQLERKIQILNKTPPEENRVDTGKKLDESLQHKLTHKQAITNQGEKVQGHVPAHCNKSTYCNMTDEEMKQLKSQIDDLIKGMSDSSMEMEALRKKAQISEQKYALVKEQSQDIKELHSSLKANMEKRDKELSSKNLQLEEANTKISGLQEQIEVMGAQLQKQSEILKEEEEWDNLLHKAKREVELLKEQLKEMNAQNTILQQEKAEKVSLEKQVEHLGSELQRAKYMANEEEAKQKDNEMELKNKLQDLGQKLDEMAKQNASLKEANAEAAKLRKTMKDLSSNLKQDRAPLGCDLDPTTVGHAEDEMTELQREVKTLSDLLKEKTEQITASQDTIHGQKRVIEELSLLHQSAEKSAVNEMEKFISETEQQFVEVKVQLEKKTHELANCKQEIKELESEIMAMVEETEQLRFELQLTRDQNKENEFRLEEVDLLLRDTRDKLTSEQRLNTELKTKISALESFKDGKAMEKETVNKRSSNVELKKAKSEIEILKQDNEKQKRQVDALLKDKTTHEKQASKELQDDLVPILENKIQELEEKLKQEAKELATITFHHHKTERKLRDVLKQADDETNKALSEKELLEVRARALKQQIEDSKQEAMKAEQMRKNLETELQAQIEANCKLQQLVETLEYDSRSRGDAGSLGNLLTSV